MFNATPLLPFISDEDLYNETKQLISKSVAANASSEESLYSNVVDPFSAVFDTLSESISMTEWLKSERKRQIQKTIQNALGTYHQEILGKVTGWRSLGTGEIVDLVNDQLQIIAEVKNKHNTTKGNHKRDIYDDLANVLDGSHQGYTGYYVEIIPSSRKPYNKPFTPSDNVTKTRRAAREDIRVIDGKSFYAMATGYPNAIDMFYHALPIVIGYIMGKDPSLVTNDSAFDELFYRAYLK